MRYIPYTRMVKISSPLIYDGLLHFWHRRSSVMLCRSMWKYYLANFYSFRPSCTWTDIRSVSPSSPAFRSSYLLFFSIGPGIFVTEQREKTDKRASKSPRRLSISSGLEYGETRVRDFGGTGG